MNQAFCHVVAGIIIYYGFCVCAQLRSMNDDLLTPYKGKHGSKHSNREVRDLQSSEFGQSTYEIWTSHNSSKLLPVANTSYFVSDISSSYVYGHYTTVRNPLRTFSVLEPPNNGCQYNTTATVEETSKSRKCLVAQNGGFFTTVTGGCIGNIVSDGRIVQSAKGTQNANFGITSNGSLITGYITDEDVAKLNFTQLIAGVIWLVRNGKSYVQESVEIESDDSEETGTLRYFSDVVSARTAIGHDREGRVVLVQIDGQTRVRGTNLPDFARFLIEQLHLVNAINLDGGGSATLVLNGTLANYPSDHCKGAPMWRCARSVTTAICAHEPDCLTECQNGNCILGSCVCAFNWEGESCDILKCSHHNCSGHGQCMTAGCLCNEGWHGQDCSVPCRLGFYGMNCTQRCRCRHEAECDPVSGKCSCSAGYYGESCDQSCPVGRYGRNCIYHCHCSESCLCNPITGECLSNLNLSNHQDITNLSKCLAENYWKSVPLQESLKDKNNLHLLLLLCTTIAALMISIFFNIAFMWRTIAKNSANEDKDQPVSDQSQSSVESDSTDSSQSSSSDALLEQQQPISWKEIFQPFFKPKSARYTRIESNEDIEMEEVSPLHRTA